MAYRSFVVPRDIFYGVGALDSLATIKGNCALIVTDPGIRELGLIQRVENILDANNISTAVFDKVEPDPSKETVWNIFHLAEEFKPDIFIGLGGGSAIDAGKAGWVLYEHPNLAERSLNEFLRKASRLELRKKARYVAISTTSGTGSEVTSAAVITNRNVKPVLKTGFGSRHLVPDVAIADPELAATMPPEVTANTGFDALVHAIECYVLARPSDMVDSVALWSANTICQWLPKAVKNGNDMEARDKMHVAALQAGIAFSNSRLGLVHGLAHHIGAVFGIPHGRANAFMLCPVFAFLYPGHRERLSSLAISMGISGKDDRTRVTNLLEKLDKLKEKVGIPLAIKGSGPDESEFIEQADLFANFYIERLEKSPNADVLTPRYRQQNGIPESTDDVNDLFMHAWKGTRMDLK